MEIASESVHQLLAFVDGVSRQGHPLSAVDFESYERSPSRTVHRFTRFAAMAAMMAGGPAESQLEWLDRVGWLQKNAGTVMITDLGRAVLRSLDEAANVPEGPLDVILDANEPTSYATVVGKIAGVGEALLVDPYCRLAQLWDIARHTSVDRVLTSAAIGKEWLVEMELALPVLAKVAGSALDVRVSEKGELHDRYVIPLSLDPPFVDWWTLFGFNTGGGPCRAWCVGAGACRGSGWWVVGGLSTAGLSGVRQVLV